LTAKLFCDIIQLQNKSEVSNMTNFEKVLMETKEKNGKSYDRAEVVKNTLNKQCKIAAENSLYTVSIFWISPLFDVLEHRVAYFEEYSEAEECAKRFKENCIKYNGKECKMSIYINGILYIFNDDPMTVVLGVN
jgi:hypothetical protein